jgi:hypothetical protein
MNLRMIEIQDDGPVVHSLLEAADRSTYRSIYLPLLRGETPRSLAAFNPVIQTLVTGKRDATTVATQALFMLNSPFVQEQSLYLANRLLAEPAISNAERIRQAYELIFSRDPSPQEVVKIRVFLSRYETSYGKFHVAASSGNPYLTQVSDPASDITTSVIRADDEADMPQASVEKPLEPENAKEAAWACFVQSLYASAEFEFVR